MGIITMKRNFLEKYRYSLILLRELVITDFKLRYQGSALGYLWSLLRPLFLFVILYVVFVYFLKIGNGIAHWPVAMLLGIVLWNFFAEVTNQGLKSIVGSGGIIRKINFPKYVIVLATSASAFINLLINLIVVAIFMVVNQVELSWSILLLPFFIVEIFLFGVGLAFILGTAYVKFRDVNYIWEIIMQALFYGSAIIYPISRVIDMSPVIAQVILFNPAAQAVQDARAVAVSSELPTLYSVSGSVLMSLIPHLIVIVVLVCGAWLFKKRSPYFAEEV